MNLIEDFDLNYRRKFFSLPLYAHIPNLLSQSEIEEFVRSTADLKFNQASVYSKGQGFIDRSVRKTRVKSLNAQGKIFEKVQKAFVEKNSEIWKIDTQFEFENMQYSEYKKGDFFSWHLDGMDDGFKQRRLFTMVLFLSQQKTYVGGEFEIKDWTQKAYPIEQTPGSLLVFPSGVLHQVKPVKSGVRRTLVFFVRVSKDALS
jgi:predicted 2-oxoglutarate/Fe(II)-dependent dioxygenase YbiX